jgi:predicted amidohydrolase
VALIGQAHQAGVELLVFPELALSPYFAATVRDDAEALAERTFPSAETQPIVDAVRAAGIVTVVPHAELTDGVLYNSCAVLDGDGSVLGRYRKSHIPGRVEPDPDGGLTIREKLYFTPGDLGFPLYPSPAGGLGVGICYDRRFPEMYRCYALQGAGIIACCFNTPIMEDQGATMASTQEAQELAVRGGAVANGLPIIAAGKAGIENGVRYSGGSCVIDHKGGFAARAGTDGDELVVADLDLAAAAKARARMDLEENRRPELYGLLTEVRKPVDTFDGSPA